MFERYKTNKAVDRLVEEKLYEIALDEIETGNIRRGIYGKAIAASEGNKEKANSLYVKYRVEAIKDEAQVLKAIENSLHSIDKASLREIIESYESPIKETNVKRITSNYVPVVIYANRQNTTERDVISKIQNNELDGYLTERGQWLIHKRHTSV